MKTEFPESQIAGCTTDDALKVSIIYEDVASGLRAKRCLDRLAANLNAGPDVFALRLWSFDLLSDPCLRRSSAREASDYEIIFLSVRDSGEPSPVLKEWLGEWLKCRGSQTCALAVLQEGEQASETPLLRYLSGVADAGGLDLVCPSLERPEIAVTHASIRQIARRAINASPLLEGILDDWESSSHWGINE